MIVDGKATMATNAEIQKMLYKLKDLIPGIPTDRKLSKLEIMQCVIDYIADLEQVLETEGTNSHPTLTPFQLVN